jgi:lipid-A-disaccharide synthase
MRRYVDHILGILPFEPEAHRRLGGPPCSYVGHPLTEKLDWLEARNPEALRKRLGIADGIPVLVVLPGSRSSEVKRLMAPFGDALRLLKERIPSLEVILPVVAIVRGLVEEGLKSWPLRPHLVTGEDDKFASFRLARAALTASGTVTLELAVSGTPMVVAYIADALAVKFRFMLIAHSVVLPNLVLGENVFPELLQEDCVGEKLSEALLALIKDGPERDRQLEGLVRVQDCMRDAGKPPSQKAAEIVLDHLRRRN